VDRVIAFVEKNASAGRPFLAVVWFHAPHEPVVAGPDYRGLYDGRMNDEDAAYAGVITAMDEQMGRLRGELRRLGIEDHTLVLFTSDNGSSRRTPGPFRGGKGSLSEGGIRVPALLVWPEKIRGPRSTESVAHTDDLFPTVLDAAGIGVDATVRPIDGVSLMPLIEGRSAERSKPMAFEFRTQRAYIDPPYKILSIDDGRNFALYNLARDPREEIDLAGSEPERLASMIAALESHRASWARSREGDDFR
jgi:arylsulfatase A-like enzyme